jgi:hypothetical protein
MMLLLQVFAVWLVLDLAIVLGLVLVRMRARRHPPIGRVSILSR